MNTDLENFDDLFRGHPVEIEKNLTALLPQAEALEDKSIYLQIMSQVALAKAMQQKFSEAHNTLDKAEAYLAEKYHLARVRLLLERGRVFYQANASEKALGFFVESYKLSKEHEFDYHTINAAHMVAIATPDPADKIKWNQIAISLASATKDARAREWLSALHNNLAQNYLQAEQYSKALAEFELCKKFGEVKGQDNIMVRGAKWGIARSLRSLGHLEEALEMQLELLKEYEAIAASVESPTHFLIVGRGLVYEELAEIHRSYMRGYSRLAYQDLAQDPWFARLEPERLEKLNKTQE